MPIRKLTAKFIMAMLILFAYNTLLGGNTESTPQEKNEYKSDFNRVEDMRAFLRQNDTRDLNVYEEFADSIDQKWRGRNREYYARLMSYVCAPLSSGTFKEDRQYELARKYALSALEEPDSIPLELELNLKGHVRTLRSGPSASSGDVYAEKRTKDTEVILHAWKRFLDAFDPNWDPYGTTWVTTNSPSAGIDTAAIQDSAMQAEYEEARRLNNQAIEKYREQNLLHNKWLLMIPGLTERRIILAFSYPPYATEELRKMLDEYLTDQEVKTRIIETVEKNIQESQEGMR